MSESNEKVVPGPVPQAAPYEVRFPGAARPTGASGDGVKDDVAPVPQGAPTAGSNAAKIKE